WHPDALDLFDDHLGPLSRFSNIQVCDVWITSISISHWRLQTEAENYIYTLETELEEDNKREDSQESRKYLILGKRNLSEEGQPQLSTIRELSMSVVFTGDRMGRCWTCTILSEVIDEEAAQGYTKEINDILQMFIHQQYTGRILSFILLLGYLCESLSKECEKFTVELDKIMGIDPMVLLRGIEWHKSDVALKKLKEMLWGLEALRVFDDKLGRALQEISQGEEQTKKELIRRDVERVIEEFEKRRDRLENAHVSILQRMEQSNRIREGVSQLMLIRNIEQNENISMLTWVAILYLPLSFITGVFSIGHSIVPQHASWVTFGWLMIVFVFVTIIFALILQVIIGRLRPVRKNIGQIFMREKTGTFATQILTTKAPEGRKITKMFGMGTFGLRRRCYKEPSSDDLETCAKAE
ncbi:hypothetical protein F5882DRAFT_311324, partial [Hyaloscypha sp. PMI_1271]